MLRAGAKSVVGIEADPQSAELAFERAANARLAFLPLLMDAANASPSQGWRNAERSSFAERGHFDAVVALAFAHHLAIGRNVPLKQVIAWMTGIAPRGLIEFVPRDDPTVQRMLALRDTRFEDYSESVFRSLLSADARIVREDRVSATGRTLFWFERN
jgi:ribosomal protein L11 methylase PrmA